MHRLEITGTTPEELYFNAIKTLSIFLRGAAQTTAPVETSEAPVQRTSDAAPRSEPLADEKTTVLPPKTRRGKKDTEPKVLNDEMPDLGAKTIEHDASEVKRFPPGYLSSGPKQELTLDGDIRPRLQAIQAAHTKRGNDMPACVAYIQKLYGPFGIANAKQLKPEQFEEFMEASEAYLAGEA